MKIIFSALLGLALALTSASAQADVNGAKGYINDIGNKAIAIASSGKPQAQRMGELERLFGSSVDMEWVAKFVLGKYWRDATAAQKSAYLKNYRDFVLKHYTANFSDYTTETFKITNAIDDGSGQYTVTMHILRPGKEDIVVDYRVRQGSGYRLFDIIVEGVSLITTQRSEFGAVVDRNGLDYLINQLGQKAQTEQAKMSQ